MSTQLLAGDAYMRIRPDEWPFFYLAAGFVALNIAYRSVKAYREGRRERVKPSDPRSDSNQPGMTA
jgi:hypothetical protein